MRGEYNAGVVKVQVFAELPPRARRILGGGIGGGVGVNYLRVRGEYKLNLFNTDGPTELPPRARRIRKKKTTPVMRVGTTSACAENTARPIQFSTSTGNYLRVRGEYIEYPLMIDPTPELPPRARRILACGLVFGGCDGTTSACAENTAYQPGRTIHPRNYLRVRGEYWKPWEAPQAPWELPPRARRIP